MKIHFIIPVVLLSLAACKSEEKKAEAPATIPAADMNMVMIQHPVANFEAWLAVYNGHDSVRKAYGLTSYIIGRGIDDSNMVFILNKMADTAKAHAFAALPDLKAAMEKGGVTGAPIFEYVHVIRNDTSATDIKDRIMIKHRVKDFDAWLKVYDNEGMETRKSFGMIDRGMARGIDDPNMVYVVFAVSDWAKANARSQSEELKKLMTDAGVEGPPTILKYRLTN